MGNHSLKWILAFAICAVIIAIAQLTLPGVIAMALLLEMFRPIPLINWLVLITAVVAASFFSMGSRRWVRVMVQALALIGLIMVWTLGLWHIREEAGSQRMLAIHERLEQMRERGQPYPVSLADVPELAPSVFAIDDILYRLQDGEYEICWYQIPLGPFKCYGSKKKEWFYGE